MRHALVRGLQCKPLSPSREREVVNGEHDRLDLRLREGRLDGETMRAVAGAVAAFHERAEPVDPAAIDATEHVGELVRLELGGALPPEAKRAERVQLDFLARESERIELRAQQRRVRHVHGELGLEHVFVDARGEVQLIDRLDTDPRLRRIDVCADVALLADELAVEGRSDLAERFLADYAAASDDFDLYPLVDFYAGLRASLRGKLAAERAALAGPGERGERSAARARRYFLLALAARRQPLLPPVVVATGGQVASGKSTLARALAAEIGAPVVSTDRTRDCLLGMRPGGELHEVHWEQAYEPGFSERVYGEVLRRAGAVLASGRPVVVDGCFRSRVQRAAVQALAAAYGYPFYFVEARIPLDVQRARLHERSLRDGEPDSTWHDIAEALRREWEPAYELDPTQRLVLDTSQPLVFSVAELRAALPTWPDRLTG
jgi:predicted kinase